MIERTSRVASLLGGLAYTFVKGGHVRIDLVTSHLPPGARAWLRAVTLALGLALIAVVIWVTTRSSRPCSRSCS